ncbi:MAG: cell envelope biogenesis protein OmpA, partial [Nautilia sp.]
DGVLDKNDKCPNTPAGMKVDKKGCQIVLDSDHDGVLDKNDKCPNTPLGIRVDKNGCALDSDHDGVADNIDQCPNTPKGVVVNDKGCAVTFNFDVHFNTNSARLNIHYLQKVKKFAEFLKQNPAYKAEIEGYTDNVGSKKYNILLSEKRAKAVYNILIKLGISPSRLSYKGFGPLNPIASNKTKEGRKLNRRVVAKLFL